MISDLVPDDVVVLRRQLRTPFGLGFGHCEGLGLGVLRHLSRGGGGGKQVLEKVNDCWLVAKMSCGGVVVWQLACRDCGLREGPRKQEGRHDVVSARDSGLEALRTDGKKRNI